MACMGARLTDSTTRDIGAICMGSLLSLIDTVCGNVFAPGVKRVVGDASTLSLQQVRGHRAPPPPLPTPLSREPIRAESVETCPTLARLQRANKTHSGVDRAAARAS